MENALSFAALLTILAAAAFCYQTFRWKCVWFIFDIGPGGMHKAVFLRFKNRYKIYGDISALVAKQSSAIDWSIRLAAFPKDVQHKIQIRIINEGKISWQPLSQFVNQAFAQMVITFPNRAVLDPEENEWIEHLIKEASKHESSIAFEWLIELSRSPNLSTLIAEHIIGLLQMASCEGRDVNRTIGLCRLFGTGIPHLWFDQAPQDKCSLFESSMKMSIVQNLLTLALIDDPEINWAATLAIDKNLTINDYDVLEYLLSTAQDKSANRLIRILALDILRHCYRLDFDRQKVWPSLEWIDSMFFRRSMISTDRDVEIQHATLKLGSFCASLRHSATTWQRGPNFL